MRVDDLIGVPFADGGRGPDSYDCWGLVREVFKRHGITLRDYTACCYDIDEVNAYYKNDMVPHWKRHEWPNVPVPAVVAMRFYSPFVNHVGAYIGNGKFLHARGKTGVVVERVESSFWQHRIEGYYTLE